MYTMKIDIEKRMDTNVIQTEENVLDDARRKLHATMTSIDQDPMKVVRGLDATWRQDLDHPTATVLAVCRKNNTHLHLRWKDVETHARCQMTMTAGQLKFAGRKRGTPYAAEKLAEDLGQRWRARLSPSMKGDKKIRRIHIEYKGFGRGRNTIAKGFANAGRSVVSVSDSTGTPHGGCRPKNPRRV
jgi:ribosomal protein S11